MIVAPQLLNAVQKARHCLIAVLQSSRVKCTVMHECVCVWTQVVGGWLAPTLSSMLVGSTTFVGATPPISLLLPHFARPVNDMGPVQVDSNDSRVLIDLKHVLYLG